MLLLGIVGAWIFTIVALADFLPSTIEGRSMAIVEGLGLTYLGILTFAWVLDARRRATESKLGVGRR